MGHGGGWSSWWDTNKLEEVQHRARVLVFPRSRLAGLIKRDLLQDSASTPCCWCGVGPASAVVSTGNDTRQHIKMGHTLSRIFQWTCV